MISVLAMVDPGFCTRSSGGTNPEWVGNLLFGIIFDEGCIKMTENELRGRRGSLVQMNLLWLVKQRMESCGLRRCRPMVPIRVRVVHMQLNSLTSII